MTIRATIDAIEAAFPPNHAKTIEEVIRRIGTCRLCNGRKKYLPSCFRCDDSTDDHECPGWELCNACEETGLVRDAHMALSALEKLVASTPPSGTSPAPMMPSNSNTREGHGHD